MYFQIYLLLKLFRNKNLISMTEKGLFVLMPFVVKAMQRLIDIIDEEMALIGAQKIVMPSLVSKHLWDKSGLKTIDCILTDISSDEQVVGMNRVKNSLD